MISHVRISHVSDSTSPVNTSPVIGLFSIVSSIISIPDLFPLNDCVSPDNTLQVCIFHHSEFKEESFISHVSDSTSPVCHSSVLTEESSPLHVCVFHVCASEFNPGSTPFSFCSLFESWPVIDSEPVLLFTSFCVSPVCHSEALAEESCVSHSSFWAFSEESSPLHTCELSPSSSDSFKGFSISWFSTSPISSSTVSSSTISSTATLFSSKFKISPVSAKA